MKAMTASKIFLYFCLAFIGGIFLNSIIGISQIYMLGFLISGILLISVFWEHKKIVVVGFCILFLVFGAWRHQATEFRIDNNELRKFNDRDEAITLVGVVGTEPDIREKSVKLTIEVQSMAQKVGVSPSGYGKVLVTTWRYPEYQYGDKLEIEGKLEAPPVFEDFNYKDYLAKEGIYSVMYGSEIKLLERGKGNFLFTILFSFKNKLEESVNKVMSPPQSGILQALFFGNEQNISTEWKEKFNLTGTRHITAVSGMNITIISALVFNFLLALGFWRGRTFYFSIAIIFFYILMIGAPASGVRAGIMGSLFLIAQYFGRISIGARAIVIASVFMLVHNPLLLTLDVGFQLSFLAVLGLIYLLPHFLLWLKRVPDFLTIRYSLAATLAAQVFTLPILIYNFGRIPIISPIINILIVPILPFITILGFLFSLLGVIWLPLGQILSWPAWLLLTYEVKIIDWFSQIFFVSLSVENLHWIWLVISYLILGFIVWRLQKKVKLKFLNL